MEKKAVFLQSIPRGLEILNYLLQKIDQSSVPGYFREVLEALSREKNKYAELPKIFDGLTLTIYSFSYRKPLPDDISGNGGGFVYDCRFLSNPGRCDEFKKLTGLDPEVQKFLNDDPEVPAFINTVKEQLNSVISSYKAQGYTNLMISFGCTGGRHRSVFMTKTIADWCRQLDGIRVLEIHREIEAEY